MMNTEWEQLSWEQQASTVRLQGCLNKHSVATLWDNRSDIFRGMDLVNLAQLSQLDSVGLAALVNCCLSYQLKLVGLQKAQQILTTLYNLNKVIIQDGDA